MARARAERLWLGGTAFAAVLIALVGWFLLVSPQRAETEDVQSQIADAQLQNNLLQARIGDLKAEQSKLSRYAAALAAARLALPESKDMSAFLRTLQTIGDATSTKLTAVTVGDPEAIEPTAGTAPTPPAASSAPSSAPSPASTSGAPAAGSTTGVFAIPITASISGRPSDLTRFLVRLQSQQPRAVLVQKVTRGSDSDRANAVSSLQLTMSAFVAPAADAAAAASPSASPSTGGD